MKLIAVTSLLVGCINAENTISFDTASACANLSMDEQIDNLLCGPDRLFSGGMATAINNMNEMGCWCYFGDDHGRGKGQPIDELDGLCKTLHEGYECAMRDAEVEGTTCVPWEIAYSSAIGSSSLSLNEACEQANAGNNCATRACCIEGAFVESLLIFFSSGGIVEANNKHSNGFDPKVSCPTKAGGVASAKSCCGSYPARFPFKTLGGDRGCCGDRTFNKLSLTCCDEDSSTVKFNC